MKKYEMAGKEKWVEALKDSCTEDWRKHWTLDGLKAKITHSPKGMDFSAGPVFGDDSCHAVMWTKQSFSGDVRIDYEYTRTDNEMRGVTILYLLATGSGIAPYSKDIAEWGELREIPHMKTYFNNMNTYHLSYAAFGVKNQDPNDDYIRARRYMPEAGKGLKETDLPPDYFKTDFFKTGVPHKITIIRKGDDLFMHIDNGAKKMLCHWGTSQFPAINEGRIGLRHMYTRSARYRDFRVSVLKK